MAILIAEEAELRPKSITRKRQRHYVMIKESFHQGDITVLNVYMFNKELQTA